MARTIGFLENMDASEIHQLISAAKNLIFSTLDASVEFPIANGKHVLPPRPYKEFAELLVELADPTRYNASLEKRTIAVLTFNYDLAVDYALQHVPQAIDYFIGPDRVVGGIPLLKLHGSLNWSQCSKCRKIEPLSLKGRFKGLDLVGLSGSRRSMRLSFSDLIEANVHCENSDSSTMIVPPTWNKTEHHLHIAPVWNQAARELSEAEDIIVIGYSLPESDEFFKLFFAIATVGDSILRRLWVFDPDAEVAERFRKLLGPGSEQRFEFFEQPFRDAIPAIRSAYRTNAAGV